MRINSASIAKSGSSLNAIAHRRPSSCLTNTYSAARPQWHTARPCTVQWITGVSHGSSDGTLTAHVRAQVLPAEGPQNCLHLIVARSAPRSVHRRRAKALFEEVRSWGCCRALPGRPSRCAAVENSSPSVSRPHSSLRSQVPIDASIARQRSLAGSPAPWAVPTAQNRPRSQNILAADRCACSAGDRAPKMSSVPLTA